MKKAFLALILLMCISDMAQSQSMFLRRLKVQDSIYIPTGRINASAYYLNGVELIFGGSLDTSLFLRKTNNLFDLNNITTAKTNLLLNNVNNTTDANKPVSTATQTALDLKQNLSEKNQNGGYVGIDANRIVFKSVSGVTSYLKNENLSSSKTYTFKDENYTVIGETTTDVLTNKSISGTTNTFSDISEGSLSFTDITTNNASTTKHGFLKKLSNVATEYMDGTGNFSVPAGGITGPGSSTDNAIVRFNGTDGQLVQNSGVTIDDNGKVGIGITPSLHTLDVLGSTDHLVARIVGPSGGGLIMGDFSSIYGGIWSAGVTPSQENYSIVISPTRTNLGVPADGVINFNIGGTNRLTFDGTTYSLGIRTTAPTAAVDINSDVFRLRTAKTPSSATDTGEQGEIAWDANYVYVCIATNSWKRSAISTWP